MGATFILLVNLQRSHVRFSSSFKRRRITYKFVRLFYLRAIQCRVSTRSKPYHTSYQALRKSTFFHEKYKLSETNYFTTQEVVNKAPSQTSNKDKVTCIALRIFRASESVTCSRNSAKAGLKFRINMTLFKGSSLFAYF